MQTGDPEGPADGFIDPGTEKLRTIPLEIMVIGDKTPVYGETLEVSFLFCKMDQLQCHLYNISLKYLSVHIKHQDPNCSPFLHFSPLGSCTTYSGNVLLSDKDCVMFGHV